MTTTGIETGKDVYVQICGAKKLRACEHRHDNKCASEEYCDYKRVLPDGGHSCTVPTSCTSQSGDYCSGNGCKLVERMKVF